MDKQAEAATDLLAAKDAAQRIGISLSRFRTLVDEGRIPIAWRPGREMFFDPVFLDRYREARALFLGHHSGHSDERHILMKTKGKRP